MKDELLNRISLLGRFCVSLMNKTTACAFGVHPSSFTLHPSPFTLHPSSFSVITVGLRTTALTTRWRHYQP